MPDGYSSHADYLSWVADNADNRQETVRRALKAAFSLFIESRSVEVIVFSNMSALDLAKAIINQPSVLKPLVALCNIAARAIERDLQIRNVDTYTPRLTEEQAAAIAGYIKPFLPNYIEIPSLLNVDRISFIDKEIRKGKGRWERIILNALNRYGKESFKKRKFVAAGESFELDAASPSSGEIRIAIDVKRIEARRDIHKRCDEIVNKANKFKSVAPASRFAAIIYYPFIDEHINIQSRLSSVNIDGIAFASESVDSVESAIRLLLARLDMAK